MCVAIQRYSIRLSCCRIEAFTVQTVQQKNADPNTFVAAKATVYWPFEEGPFAYEANMRTA